MHVCITHWFFSKWLLRRKIHVCSIVPLVVTKNVLVRQNIPNLCCHLDLLHTLPFNICFSYAFFYITPWFWNCWCKRCLAPFPVVFEKAHEAYTFTSPVKSEKQRIEKKVAKLFFPQLCELCSTFQLNSQILYRHL